MAIHHNKKESSGITIADAVETLSSIADLDFDKEIGVTQKNTLVIQDTDEVYHTVNWLHTADADETVKIVRDTFRVILQYLQGFYRSNPELSIEKEVLEGVKTIMLLVGEAAQKLDRYNTLFKDRQGSITKLEEYQQLQDFYNTKLAKKIIEEEVKVKWSHELPAITEEAQVILRGKENTQASKHVYVDLEHIKRDSEYELFLIRKEDGSLFYSPQVIRSVKLVCDFGSYFGEKKSEDPFVQIPLWIDKCIQVAAKQLFETVKPVLNLFFQEAARYKNNDLVCILNKASMALLLSANPRNLLQHSPVKCCGAYFADFQLFLREAMQVREYHKLVAYPPKRTNRVGQCLVTLAHTLCKAIFTQMRHLQALIPEFEEIIKKAHPALVSNVTTRAEKSWWQTIFGSYETLTEIMKKHPHGPLLKIAELIENERGVGFDSLIQNNLPCQLYRLKIDNRTSLCLSIPSPTRQEFIHKVFVTDEFKAFLRAYHETNPAPMHHLVINLQDRTHWREHKRCLALEELQLHKDFKEALTVVSLTKDTDFYHQLTPYHNLNHADEFIQQFKDHLADEGAGYYFPENVRKTLFPTWINQAMNAVHRLFFSGKNVLLRKNRLDFIEIFYLFLELKLIEITRANSFSLTCKDEIDTGNSASATLYSFLKILSREHLSDEDDDYLCLLIHLPSVMLRERSMLFNRTERMINAIKHIENSITEKGSHPFFKQFYQESSSLYDKGLLSIQVKPVRLLEGSDYTETF